MNSLVKKDLLLLLATCYCLFNNCFSYL